MPARPPLDEEVVRSLLSQRFPELKIERVERINEGGARTFHVDEGLIVRFAVDDEDAAKLEREVALLAELGPLLPLAVPNIKLIGEASDAHPYPFVGYRTIAGASGEIARPPREKWPPVAAQFGEFLSALHAFPVERAQALGVPEASNEAFGAEYRTRDAAELLGRVRALAPTIRQELPELIDERTEPYLSGRVTLPLTSQLAPVLCHADLKGEHIIISEQADAVLGVIDWADCTVTDPLLDFTGLTIWLGETFVRQVLAHYTRPVDEHFVERVCFYSRCFSLDNLGWRLTTDWAAPLELLRAHARWAFAKP